jgi:hypothetical protein
MQPKLRFPLLILAAALLALPASAAAGTKTSSDTAAGNFAIASATAKCPSGQRATGGGFTAPATPTVQPWFVVYESRKVGQRSWRASGQIIDPGATGRAFTVKASVYCSDGAPSTKAKSASVTSVGPFVAFLSFAADARCSSGKAQAGGFHGPPPHNGGGDFNHAVTDSYRTDKKTWRSRMTSSTPGITFTSYVYCADEKKPAARLGSTTSATSFTAHTAISAECKRGTKPVAGGFSQPNASFSPSPIGVFDFFYESVKSGKRWRVSAVHVGATTTLNSIAYCR